MFIAFPALPNEDFPILEPSPSSDMRLYVNDPISFWALSVWTPPPGTKGVHHRGDHFT